MRNLVRAFAAAAAVLVCLPAAAQFGENKIAYERHDWKVYPSPHFDIHYYGETGEFLDDIVSMAEGAYLHISKELDHELRFRVPLILYQTHADFEQTNVSLGEIPEAVGAFAEPVQNRMVLPIDLPPDKLYELISHELTHIFQYSIFFEGYLGRALRSNVPTWIMEGMASYVAKDEDNIDRMVMRDAVVNNVLPPVQALDVLSFLTYRYGHAIFDFIEQEHGHEGFRNFIYEYRKVLLTNNLEKAIKESFGYDIDEFNRRFNRYLRKKYFPVLLEKKSPDDYGKEIGVKRPGRFTFSPTISPSGELVAALATPGMELDLVVLSAEDGSLVRNLTKGWTNKYQYLVAEAFAGKRDLSWSPKGDVVAAFVRRENRKPLFLFDALKGKILDTYPLEGYAENASPAYSPDGKKIAFEANRDGIVDIFELDLETREVRNVTQDDFYDANPWYAADGRTLLYNRRIGASWKIFSVDASDPTRKTQLTFGPSSDLEPAYSSDGKTVYFSSDRGPYGVFNIHSLDLATGDVTQYTDVVGGCFSPVEMAPRDGKTVVAFSAYYEGTFRLYRMPLLQPEAALTAAEAAPATEVVPFRSPMTLTADPGKISPYRPRFDLEAPSIGLGVTDDGTLLSNVNLAFSDLLGDHRISIYAASVSDFSNVFVQYANLKHRLQWGAAIYDSRDYFVTNTTFGTARQQVQRSTGGQLFVSWPMSRYYRVEGNVGGIDQSQDFLVFDPTSVAGFGFDRVSDRFATVGTALVGDTTRYQSFGPFQGKRFRVGVDYGAHVSGDIDGDFLQYNLDFRAYRQLTRRSTLAFHLAGVFSGGDREFYYGFGGINQLRGYSYRDFFGSRIAWTNLELRFPFVDELRFPFGPIQGIRGFLFFDAGGAWLSDHQWYDPNLRNIRATFDSTSSAFVPIGFKAWDSENNRLQDLRASYGLGFQFFFLGGLQFNWAWSHRVPYTQFVPDATDPTVLVKAKGDDGGWRQDFYIVFDW